MANKYYVISGNAEITQKNRNRFSIQKFLDIITSQFNETYEIERQNHIAQYSPEDESNIVINTRIHNSEPLLQNLITEE